MAKKDSTGIYYFADKKLYKYDTKNAESIELDEPENVVDLSNDISKIAVFDDLLLLRNNDGSVEVVK